MGIKISKNLVIEQDPEDSDDVCKDNIITEEMYKGKTGLNSISISDGVTIIQRSAFENCSDLVSVKIPTSVRRIEWNAFAGCNNLNNIVVDPSIVEIDCWMDSRHVSKMTLYRPFDNELIEFLVKGYEMELKTENDIDHWA